MDWITSVTEQKRLRCRQAERSACKEAYEKLGNQRAFAHLLSRRQEEQEDFTTSIDLDVDAFIPTRYILNEEQKRESFDRRRDKFIFAKYK